LPKTAPNVPRPFLSSKQLIKIQNFAQNCQGGTTEPITQSSNLNHWISTYFINPWNIGQCWNNTNMPSEVYMALVSNSQKSLEIFTV
jgi:hypothetical protein